MAVVGKGFHDPEALRRGWYLDEEGLNDKLSGKNSNAGDAEKTHHQVEAKRIISILARQLGLPDSRDELEQLKKKRCPQVSL